jgi:hypothetical protein
MHSRTSFIFAVERLTYDQSFNELYFFPDEGKLGLQKSKLGVIRFVFSCFPTLPIGFVTMKHVFH